MVALAAEPRSFPTALPGPYDDAPDGRALAPHPATVCLVRGVVRDLLREAPGFWALSADDRVALAHNLVRVGSYLAECVRDDWYQSGRLDQRPMLRTRSPVAMAQAAGDDFRPAAASQVGRVTTDTLRAVAFPTFVADLIRGTFNAIADASQKQMDAYMQLLENVGKTVEQFTNDNISDDSARAWLADRYPHNLQLGQDGRLAPVTRQPPGSPPDFTADLDLTASVDPSDSGAIEDTLVPAARRKLAQMRLKMLSALVLMGVNRIVVTGGKIRATMGFHINTRDTAHAESASQLDTRTGVSGSFAYGPFSIGASLSIAYVSSTKADSNAELNTQTDLTGEVELHFQSDYFPIERFADAAGINQIRSNTPVPAANAPVVHDTVPWGDTSPPRPVEGLGPARQPSSTPFAALPPAPAATPPVPSPTTTAPAGQRTATPATTGGAQRTQPTAPAGAGAGQTSTRGGAGAAGTTPATTGAGTAGAAAPTTQAAGAATPTTPPAPAQATT